MFFPAIYPTLCHPFITFSASLLQEQILLLKAYSAYSAKADKSLRTVPKKLSGTRFSHGSRKTCPREQPRNQVPLSDANAFSINSPAVPSNPLLDGPEGEQPVTQGGPTHACEWMPILK